MVNLRVPYLTLAESAQVNQQVYPKEQLQYISSRVKSLIHEIYPTYSLASDHNTNLSDPTPVIGAKQKRRFSK